MWVSSCGPSYYRGVVLNDTILKQGKAGLVVGVIQRRSPINTNLPSENDPRDRELFNIYRKHLKTSFVKSGIDYEEGQEKVIVDITIYSYNKGNAFARWLLPGAGTSRLLVQAAIKKDAVLIGAIESQQSISWGGGFSIGGWQHVINWSAKDIGSKICSVLYANTEDSCS